MITITYKNHPEKVTTNANWEKAFYAAKVQAKLLGIKDFTIREDKGMTFHEQTFHRA